MSNVFDKRIFKSKDNYNNLINLKIYEANLKLFNINSLLGKVYPSLLSKCISFKNGNYWEKRFNSIYEKITWEFRVRVSVIVRGTIPDKVADPTNVSLYNKLMTDPTIGGLAIDIKPSTVNFEIIEADQPAGVISNEFDIEYRSSYNNLST